MKKARLFPAAIAVLLLLAPAARPSAAVLEYSTFLGGDANDEGYGVIIDENGRYAVTGMTMSVNFPTAGNNIHQPGKPSGSGDVFVSHFNPDGSLRFSTYLGGSAYDEGYALSFINTDHKFPGLAVTGYTTSIDFPQMNVVQKDFGGGSDAFLTFLNDDGSLALSSFIGGEDDDWGLRLAATNTHVYVAGLTESADFPTRGNPPQPAGPPPGRENGFLLSVKYRDVIPFIEFSTFWGGSDDSEITGLALDDEGGITVAGWTIATDFFTHKAILDSNPGTSTGFVTRFDSSFTPVFSTYLGGADRTHVSDCDQADGKIVVVGKTQSADFPTAGQPWHASKPSPGNRYSSFVSRFDLNGNLEFSSYFGDNHPNVVEGGIEGVSTGGGYTFVGGLTNDTEFPTVNPYQAAFGGGASDSFLAAIDASDTIRFSTYFGGSDEERSILGKMIGSSGPTAILTGRTQSADFPTAGDPFQAAHAGGRDAFLAIFRLITPTPTAIPTPSTTPSTTPTSTPTPSPTATPSPSASPTPTNTPIPTPPPTVPPTPPPTVPPTPPPTVPPTPPPTVPPTPPPTVPPTPPPTAPPSPVPSSTVSCFFSVSGAVLDETTSSPLVGAEVTMTYSDALFDTTSSGAEGVYSFMIYTPHAPGPVTVEAEYPGYRTGSALTSWDCQTVISGLDILLAPITPPPAPTPPAPRWIYDYSGDGTSDVAIFRPASGLWAVRGLTRVYFGAGGDLPVPGDYRGDGTTAPAIFRPTSGLWAVRGVTRAYFGGSGDQPFPLDYAGDGTTDPAIFRPASGLWAIRGVTRVYFGSSDDQPVPGYYQGDRAVPAIFRPASGLWAIRGVSRVYFGSSGDTPVPGSYRGSENWETAIYRASSGLWAVRGFTRIYFGTSADTPIPGVYDGGESDRFGVFRPASGLWAVRGLTRVYFGSSSDIPVTR